MSDHEGYLDGLHARNIMRDKMMQGRLDDKVDAIHITSYPYVLGGDMKWYLNSDLWTGAAGTEWHMPRGAEMLLLGVLGGFVGNLLGYFMGSTI